MDLEEFACIVSYTLTPDCAPTPAIVSAVRHYNQLRVAVARQLSEKLPADLVTTLRRASQVDVIANVPKHAKCAVTKQFIQTGVTLYVTPGETLITVASAYREPLRTLFQVFHFDDEIRAAYHAWASRSVKPAVEDFVRYNQSSCVKQLFVVFEQLCGT
jgi:hypothetical protein